MALPLTAASFDPHPQASDIRRLTITIPEHYPFQFNAESGDHIMVIMDPIGDPVQRCADMGGAELIYDPKTELYTCEDVDF